VDNHGDIGVPFRPEDEVIQPLGIGVTVTCTTEDRKVGVGKLDPGRDRDRPAVNRVEAVDVKIVAHLCVAPNPGDEHDILKGDAVCNEPFDRIPECKLEGKVPAAGAPGVLGTRDQVLFRHHGTSPSLASSSSTENGRPSILAMCEATGIPCW